MTQITPRKGRTGYMDHIIGHNIRYWRKARGTTQQQLAASLGITYQQLQKFEKGTNRISAARLFEVAILLNVPMKVFFVPQHTDNAP